MLRDADIILDNISYLRVISPRASNTLNQVAEAKRFEGVFLCRKVC